MSGTRAMPTDFLYMAGYNTPWFRRELHDGLGHDEAARRARPGQHWIDVKREQNDRTEDRGEEPAHTIAAGRIQGWRRLRLDHPRLRKT